MEVTPRSRNDPGRSPITSAFLTWLNLRSIADRFRYLFVHSGLP